SLSCVHPSVSLAPSLFFSLSVSLSFPLFPLCSPPTLFLHSGWHVCVCVCVPLIRTGLLPDRAQTISAHNQHICRGELLIQIQQITILSVQQREMKRTREGREEERTLTFNNITYFLI